VKVAVYARVSTHDQTAENQLIELRRYVRARGWSAVEYVDEGVSGAKDRRPALDRLVADVRRHRVEAVVCWRLDRLGRNLRHLVMLLDDWQSRGVAFVTLGEGIDTSTPAGRLVAGVLGSIAEFERARLQERVRAGLARVRAQGRRPGRKPCGVSDERFAAVSRLSTRHAAKQLGVSHTVVARWRAVNKTPLEGPTESRGFPASS
jgi:DNA invertase Pin-like site-specific DNA recombinase